MTITEQVLHEYREQKQKTEVLADAARKQMQDRYAELVAELSTVMNAFREMFGVEINTVAETPIEATPSPSNGKKIGGLRRSLNAATRKGDAARVEAVKAELRALGVDVDVDAADDESK